jgi:hypothetical protein
VRRPLRPRQQALGYRLARGHRDVRRTVCADAALNRKIAKVYGRLTETLGPEHRWLEASLARVGFDAGRADRIIGGMSPDPDCEMAPDAYRDLIAGHARRLADGEHYFVRDPYGRCHTLITSLPKALRCCLSYEGQHLVGLDLKNSQPLFAGLLARRYYRSRDSARRLCQVRFGGVRARDAADAYQPHPDVPADVEAYLEVCQGGGFYESFMPPGADRDAFKVKFFRDVFFGKNCVRSPVKDAFARTYPSMAAMLAALKHKDHARAAWLLQNLEARTFLHNVCGRVLRERPATVVLTVHDSVVTTLDAVGDVRGLVLDEFARYGLAPRLTEEEHR